MTPTGTPAPEISADRVLVVNDDAVAGAVLAFHDVTARDEAEARRRGEQDALKEAQRLACLGSWSWTLDRDAVTWSDEMYRIAGRSPDAGPPTFTEMQAMFGANRDTLTRAVARTVAAGEPYEMEVEMIRPGGQRRWVIARGVAVQAGGRTVALHGTAQDITERRRAHRALQLSEQRLKRQREMLQAAAESLERTERRYRDLVENLTDVVYALDTVGRFQYVSPAVRRYGYAPAELIGRPFGIIVHPDDQDAARRMFDEAATGITEPREFRALARDGGVHHLRVSSRCSFDAGRPSGLTGVAIDVTEQRRADERLGVAQRMEAVGRLAGGVAHDFNNLLVAINGYAEFAIEAVGPDDPLRADLQEILKAGHRAAALTRQLLAFSRKQVLKPEVIDLNEVVRGMEGMLRRLIGEDIDFQTVAGRDLGPVLADPCQMEQVIMNLVVNARDAMPTGGRLVIETRNARMPDAAGSPADCVVLSVCDTGCGMDEATKAQIFEPFFSTKQPGEGTGLGLPTVHGIVTQSGGTITVDTAPGRGTTFSLALQVAEARDRLAARTKAVREQRGSETVLLVEDEHGVRALATRFLSGAGYRVLAASNGGEALLTCETFTGAIDLLLTDVVMPQMGGRELWERLSQVRPGLRVLYMSGYSGSAIAHHGVLGEGVRLLEKPFSSGELTMSVRDALDAADEDGPMCRTAGRAPASVETAGRTRRLSAARRLAHSARPQTDPLV